MSSEESGYYHFNSDGKRGKNKWDAFDVDAELAKLDSDDEDEAERQRQRDQRMREKRAAKEREAQAKASADAPSAASDKADAAPSDAGDAKLALHGGGGGGGGAELSLFGGDADEENSIVHRFFNFAMGTVNITMNPFFERHIDAFDDLDDVSAKGESLEQWDIYKSYEAELETHFAKFVEREGFASAQACFDEIQRVVEADRAKHEPMLRKLIEQLQNDPALQAAIERQKAKAAAERGEDPPPSGSASAEEARAAAAEAAKPLCVLFMPLALDDLVNTVMRLGASSRRGAARSLSLSRSVPLLDPSSENTPRPLPPSSPPH